MKITNVFSQTVFLTCILGIGLLFCGCATTQYGGIAVEKLTDQQIVEELASIENQLGIESDHRNTLLAINTDPRYVVVGATTTYSGSVSGQYNKANSGLYGSFNGSGYTTYQYANANGGAAAVQGLGLLINSINTSALDNRRKAIVAEISRRQQARQVADQVTAEFLKNHPEVAAKRDLLIACLIITRSRTADNLEQLQQAADIMSKLPKGRWIGWVEAHGIPQYPYGVIVGSYYLDLAWNGDLLTGKGKASDGSEMSLTANRKNDGTIEGVVQSQVFEVKFSGQMTDMGLCMDYSGTNSGRPIRGITWAFR